MKDRETSLGYGRVQELLDNIKNGITPEELVRLRLEQSLKRKNQPETERWNKLQEMMRLVDQIEGRAEFSHIDHERGKKLSEELGKWAEERTLQILNQFPIVWYVETASEQLDHNGVDLLIHFHSNAGLPDTGVQVKSSWHYIREFQKRPNYPRLVEKFNLILVNASPRIPDNKIIVFLKNTFEQRLPEEKRALLTNVS